MKSYIKFRAKSVTGAPEARGQRGGGGAARGQEVALFRKTALHTRLYIDMNLDLGLCL